MSQSSFLIPNSEPKSKKEDGHMNLSSVICFMSSPPKLFNLNLWTGFLTNHICLSFFDSKMEGID